MPVTLGSRTGSATSITPRCAGDSCRDQAGLLGPLETSSSAARKLSSSYGSASSCGQRGHRPCPYLWPGRAPGCGGASGGGSRCFWGCCQWRVQGWRGDQSEAGRAVPGRRNARFSHPVAPEHFRRKRFIEHDFVFFGHQSVRAYKHANRWQFHEPDVRGAARSLALLAWDPEDLIAPRPDGGGEPPPPAPAPIGWRAQIQIVADSAAARSANGCRVALKISVAYERIQYAHGM